MGPGTFLTERRVEIDQERNQYRAPGHGVPRRDGFHRIVASLIRPTPARPIYVQGTANTTLRERRRVDRLSGFPRMLLQQNAVPVRWP